VAASPETIFAVATEHHLHASLTPMRSSVLERQGRLDGICKESERRAAANG
jgi:hypothetical protein